MKKRLIALAALVLVTSPALADDKEDISQRYTQLRAAMTARDPVAIKALFTKDFESTDMRGTATADEMIEDLARFRPGAIANSDTTLEKVEVSGTTANVLRRVHDAGKRTGPDGVEHTMELTRVSDDVWQRKEGQWLLRSTTLRDMQIKRDGQEVHFGGNR